MRCLPSGFQLRYRHKTRGGKFKFSGLVFEHTIIAYSWQNDDRTYTNGH